MIDTDVVVVGAGPVGLAAAIELGTRGVRVLLAERNERVGVAPRAKTTNVRTRTHLRRWGIADRLAAEAPFGIDYPNNMVFVTRLGPDGHELARFADAFNASPERDPRYPEHGQWVPQYRLEKVLLEKVRELPGVDVRLNTEFVTAEQDADGVTATLRAVGGEEFQVRAAYLIGADGARSAIRDLIGARMEGQHGLSHHYNIIFRAPGMAAAHDFGPAAIYWQIGKHGFSAVGPMDKGDLWFFAPGGAKPGQSLLPEEAAALIRERTGIDLDFEVVSADTWSAHDLLADHYADRRIILAGDACHLHPPAGGYGMNMGVGDGIDLGWKIAATLQGWGGPALIDSYEAERRPVHRKVIDEAMANYAIYVAPPPPGIEEATAEGDAIRARVGAGVQASKAREFATLGTVLGLCYESPLIAREDGPVPEHDSQVYTPSARPGCLAPHAWLPDGRSLYDLFGQGFSLVVATDADAAEIDKAVAEARALGVPLAVVRPDGVDIAALYEARLALVRPDQHVAWRGDRWTGALARATGHLEDTVPA
ncbi:MULTISPECIES: FAD-dependent monooxygenase [unclassified Sphingomonas]|uniref:FAD-dependent monooxygenase n=1 Tax=unclassified Sphingomonas TaxID=196159 RepID=UPI000929C37B|nr:MULTISPECIES: FAD-dependent monooxygenase [unclassified Sphingomonas]MBN8849722.1 FAD-dependent monooxygenase [Sphingomonas sp.]OJV34333.1 MAG: FAD-monooxygenase [Sphingomonas sp. 67-36]